LEQKVTFDFLKHHLWKAADILRGKLDPSEYRQPVMTLLCLKRLNDKFEEAAKKLLAEGKTKKQAYEDDFRHKFFVPKEARWKKLSEADEKLGEILNSMCTSIEKANKETLDGALTNTKDLMKRIMHQFFQ